MTRTHGTYYKSNNRNPFWDLIVWLLLMGAICLFCLSCKKNDQPSSAGAKQNISTSSAGTLKIKLQGFYNNDSLLFSPNHPCGSIQQCYVKDSMRWFTYSGPKTGFMSTITVQQTSAAFLVQDSIVITIYIDGAINKIASGKKFLTTTYTY